MSARILVIEDDAVITTLLNFSLEQLGYQVRTAANAAEARFQLGRRLPDLILLDWMLPDTEGITFLRQLRSDSRTAAIPIIMLTARSTENDKEHGLNQGADDYITKPFSPRELAARIKAILRRCAPQKTNDVLHYANFSINPAEQIATLNEQELTLSPTEFKLLHFLIAHPERLYSRQQLLDQVWGEHINMDERTIDVQIRRLRLALEAQNSQHYIQTVRGCGYRFSVPKN